MDLTKKLVLVTIILEALVNCTGSPEEEISCMNDCVICDLDQDNCNIEESTKQRLQCEIICKKHIINNLATDEIKQVLQNLINLGENVSKTISTKNLLNDAVKAFDAYSGNRSDDNQAVILEKIELALRDILSIGLSYSFWGETNATDWSKVMSNIRTFEKLLSTELFNENSEWSSENLISLKSEIENFLESNIRVLACPALENIKNKNKFLNKLSKSFEDIITSGIFNETTAWNGIYNKDSIGKNIIEAITVIRECNSGKPCNSVCILVKIAVEDLIQGLLIAKPGGISAEGIIKEPVRIQMELALQDLLTSSIFNPNSEWRYTSVFQLKNNLQKTLEGFRLFNDFPNCNKVYTVNRGLTRRKASLLVKFYDIFEELISSGVFNEPNLWGSIDANVVRKKVHEALKAIRSYFGGESCNVYVQSTILEALHDISSGFSVDKESLGSGNSALIKKVGTVLQDILTSGLFVNHSWGAFNMSHYKTELENAIEDVKQSEFS